MTEAIDMSRFIEAKSDQLNSDDLLGAPRTITITKVTGCDGDQPVAIYFDGDNGKPFKPCKTIRRVLVAIWGRYANDYVGRSMTLYRDDAVTFGGLQVGGIRISHMSHLDKETIVVVAKSKGKKAGMKILPLKVEASKAQPKDEPTEDKAKAWADKLIATIEASGETEVTALFEKHGKTITKLQKERPELYAEVMAKKPATDDDDPFADDTPAAAQFADGILNDLKKVETIIDLEALFAKAEPHLVAMDEADADTIRRAFDAKRERLSVPA